MSFFGKFPLRPGAGPVFGGCLIAAATVLAYANQWSGIFILDDLPTIIQNPVLRHLRALGPILSPKQGGLTTSGRPLPSLSLAVNYALGGLNPRGYHAFNLAIHLLAALVLFGLLRRIIDRIRPEQALPIAFATALLWAVHPLQTESVTYIVQRTESMMGLCYLLTLYCFIRSAEATVEAEASPLPGRFEAASRRFHGISGQGLWLMFSVLSCLAGMACKEVMVSAPLMVLLLDRALFSHSFRQALRARRSYYIALFGTWLFLAALVLSAGNRGGTSGFNVGVSPLAYWLAQFPAVIRYIGLALWPNPLIFDYGITLVRNPWAVLPAAFVVLLLFANSLLLFFAPRLRFSSVAKTQTARLVGWAGILFFALLAPTSVIPGNRQVMAEHRMYLSLAPVLALAVAGLLRLPRRPAFLAASTAVWAVALGLLTFQRNSLYGSELALYGDTVRKLPTNYFAQCALGAALFDAGRPEEARACFETALRLNPEHSDSDDNLGLYYYARGDIARAIDCYRNALRSNPKNAEAHNNLGVALLLSGDPIGARSEYERAIALRPFYPDAYNNLGNLDEREGRNADAIAALEESLREKPDSGKAADNLGVALASAGRLPEAIEQFRQAVVLAPRLPEAQNNLGLALIRVGRPEEAVPHLREAVRLKPDYPNAHHNLGLALQGIGRIDDAITEFEIAGRLQSGR